MPRGRGRAKSAKGKRGRGKGSVKSKVGLRIMGNASHDYQGYMRPELGGLNVKQQYPQKLSKSIGRAQMPVQSKSYNHRGYHPRGRAGLAFMNNRAHLYAEGNEAKMNELLKPSQRGVVHRKFNHPKSGVKISSRPRSLVPKQGRTRVKRIAAMFGNTVNKKTQYGKKQQGMM